MMGGSGGGDATATIVIIVVVALLPACWVCACIAYHLLFRGLEKERAFSMISPPAEGGTRMARPRQSGLRASNAAATEATGEEAKGADDWGELSEPEEEPGDDEEDEEDEEEKGDEEGDGIVGRLVTRRNRGNRKAVERARGANRPPSVLAAQGSSFGVGVGIGVEKRAGSLSSDSGQQASSPKVRPEIIGWLTKEEENAASPLESQPGPSAGSSSSYSSSSSGQLTFEVSVTTAPAPSTASAPAMVSHRGPSFDRLL